MDNKETTGMGAIIALIPHIFSKLKEYTTADPLSLDEKEIKRNIIKIISPITTTVNGKKYFGANSAFSKGAGKGLQSRLYKTMLADLKDEKK